MIVYIYQCYFLNSSCTQHSWWYPQIGAVTRVYAKLNQKKVGPISSVQSFSHVRLFATPRTAAHQLPCPSPTPGACSNSCPSSRWCHPIILSSVVPFSSYLQSFPASGSFLRSQFFSSGGQSIGTLASGISLSNEYPGLISFRMGWLDLLAVQGTLKNLLQHHSSKASILWHSAFFTVQISHPYMTPGKTITWTRQSFVGKVMSLLFNMLSRLVIGFLPRSKYLLISWLQSPSAVILEPPKIKSLFPLLPHLFAMKWLDQMPLS